MADRLKVDRVEVEGRPDTGQVLQVEFLGASLVDLAVREGYHLEFVHRAINFAFI
jgi:hypothetical protein